MDEIKILGGTSGYDDGCYWDYRINFEYKNHKFKYINTGSISGCSPCYIAIMMLKGDEEFLEGPRDCSFFRNPTADAEELKEYAERCIALNGEYVIEDDNV